MKHEDPEGPEDNPMLVWLFKHGWEDPDWGQSPVGQVVTASVIHELANRVTDSEIRKEVRMLSAKIMAKSAAELGSDGGREGT